jgi:tagaturonate reductase
MNPYFRGRYQNFLPMTSLTADLLKDNTLSGLPVIVPDQSLLQLPEKVLQFGTGVLLRGLPDYFFDKANRQGLFKGRVVVVKSTDTGSADTFTAQQGLYTHCIRGIEKGKQVEDFIINSSISRTLSAKSQWAEVLACAQNPELQVIISNTTEVGIQLTDDDSSLSPPESFPGKLLAFLHARYKAFKGSPESGMIIIPCELIVDNGKKLREIVLKLAEQNKLPSGFTSWLTTHSTFCNSLVDRIVPGSPDKQTREAVFQKVGYTDELLTVSEVYRLWAIEGDERIKEKLSFYQADKGVIIEPDITPYRERKLRLLNGTHTISVGLGYLYGLETVGECMNDEYLSRFISQVMQQEVVPAVPVDEESARIFAEDVLDRFRNPFIVHPLISITLQYTSKMKMRNVQTLVNYHQKYGKVPRLFALGFAAYLLFMKAVKEENGKYSGERNGTSYPINDDFAAYFYKSWQDVDTSSKEAIQGFVKEVSADTSLWGTDLQSLPGFADTVSDYLYTMLQRGVKSVVQVHVNK